MNHPEYEIVLGRKFVEDLQRLAAAARRDRTQRTAYLRKQVLAEIKALTEGASDGHHALGYQVGKGDLRDCVTCYLRSDPQRAADHRLVFRELGPGSPGGLPRRELLAVKPRQGSGNIYEHTCARLNRHPDDRQPGLNRFGDRVPGERRSAADRQAELDAKRAIAQAWAGQQPLRSSRVLRKAAVPSRADSVAGGMPFERRRSSPAPTGWPERG
ncbi:hypothetical protein [Kribbella sp. NPDC023855]|uniref:hypothetical protein n=1 Tax=Kribbella sp. NPDC023855 TaxID=3154698 RepID=UPI0033D174F9